MNLRVNAQIFILSSLETMCVFLQVMGFLREKINEEISALIPSQTWQVSNCSPL